MKTSALLSALRDWLSRLSLKISNVLTRPVGFSFLLSYVAVLELALSEVFLYRLVFENQKYTLLEALQAQPILWLEAGGWGFVVLFLIGTYLISRAKLVKQ